MMDRRQWLAGGTRALCLGAWMSLPGRAPAAVAGADSQQAAAHALNRLGFGPRPGDLASVARDPMAWVEGQLQPGTLTLPESLAARLKDAEILQADPIAVLREYVSLVMQNNAERSQAPAAAPAMQPPAPAPAEGAAPGQQPATPLGRYLRQVQLPAIESRIYRALESPRQLEEAMVDFWFNHFNVYQAKNFTRVLVGHYEHYAIRPHAMGRFRDLLGATAHHPAMLYYLDNWISVGGRASGNGRGLNENYARELMELHTLGVDGGYSQADVTQLARMLTGWTFVPPRGAGARFAPEVRVVPPGRPDQTPGFWFNERVHDAGDKLWLGQRVAGAGKAEGDAALDRLAAHPATARHIAFKLAQYFVADQPDPALVDRLARVFQAEDGHMVPVLRTLFRSDEFWAQAAVGAKFKSPYHYVLSTLRAAGVVPPNVQGVAASLAGQGMQLYGCQTPDGYKNTELAWLNPDGMSKRINFASQVARGAVASARRGTGPDVEALVAQLGPLVSPATRALADEQRQDPALALALVLGGPAMMRR